MDHLPFSRWELLSTLGYGDESGRGRPLFSWLPLRGVKLLEDRKEKRRKEKAVGGSSKVIGSHHLYVFAFVFELKYSWVGLPRWRSGKDSACQCRRCKSCGFDPWVGKILWSRKWHPTPVFLPGESHGQRSLVGYSLWGPKSWTWLKRRACMRYSLRSALYLCWRFAFSVPGLVSWVVLGFPIKSNVHFLRASWSQFAEVKCGSYSRAQMSCLPGYRVALTTSEITDVVCVCVYKEIFFSLKKYEKKSLKSIILIKGMPS